MNKMDTKYEILSSDKADRNFIDDKIVEYNASKVAFTQTDPFVRIGFVAKDSKGSIAGGINALIYCWNILTIDVLWVDNALRGGGLGSLLLKKVEQEAVRLGCHISHLDTFDFQAKEFYLKNGYEIFGELEDCPKGHTRYYFKKAL